MKRSALFAFTLTCALATTASAQNIVTNPGFETGDFSGWANIGNTAFNGVGGGIGIGGSYAGFFGAVGNTGGISQTLATTAGQGYTFSWWQLLDSGTPSSIDVWWNGSSIYAVNNGTTGGAFQQQSFGVVATGASTTIQFVIRDDPGFAYLDDISVVAGGEGLAVTPEPATMTLMATGLVGMMGAARRRRNKKVRV
jgi:hypothetical protein